MLVLSWSSSLSLLHSTCNSWSWFLRQPKGSPWALDQYFETVHFGGNKGLHTFPINNQIVNILGPVGSGVFVTILSFTVARKQSQIIHEQMSTAVSQENLIYKSRHSAHVHILTTPIPEESKNSDSDGIMDAISFLRQKKM